MLLTFLFNCGITRAYVYMVVVYELWRNCGDAEKQNITLDSVHIAAYYNTQQDGNGTELKAMKMCDIQRVATSIDESIRNCDRGNTLLKEMVAYMGGDAESVLELIAHNWWA